MDKWVVKNVDDAKNLAAVAGKSVADENASLSECAAAVNEENAEPKRKKYEINFRKEWKKDYPWLVEDTTMKQGKKCAVCNVGIYGNLNHILRHAKCEMHKKNERTAKCSLKISDIYMCDSEVKIKNAVKDLEIRLSLFVAEHNLSFRCLDHLIKCLKTVKDSKTISQMSLNRTKGQKIISSVTGPENCKNMSEITKRQYYSIIIDESTDITTRKVLAVVIRVYDKKCQDRFLDLVPVTNSTAAGIYESLIQLLNSRQIPLDKLLEFSADNCNVMMGKNNSVQTKLKEICPHLFVNGDICHNLNLACEAAATVLPCSIDKLMFKINHHFCHSASRKSDFTQLQEHFGNEVHVILRFCTTRWLSREAVVNRLLQKWTTLQYYFTLVKFETGNGNESNTFICDTLSDPKTKLYFYFLSYILKMVNDINREMQHEDARIHILLPRLEFLFKEISRNFIEKEKLAECSITSLDLNLNHLPLSNIYCGTEIELYCLNNDIHESELTEFKNCAFKFYLSLCNQLKKRVDFDNNVLKMLPIFEPKHVVSGKTNSILKIIYDLFPKTELENANNINSEYRALASYPEVNLLKNLDISRFWWEISQIKNELNESMFSNIFRIVQGILSLPHSSACVERIFSIQNLIKTKCRNRLALPTCSALIQTKDLIKANNMNCFDFNTKDLLKYAIPNKDLNENELIFD